MQEAPLQGKDGRVDAEFGSWIADLEEQADERGYFEPLGKSHSALLTDAAPTLLVSFETTAAIHRGSGAAEPLGWHLTRDNGWSNLCLLAHGDSWFRSKAVYGYFDRLVDDGFFEDFDQVVFYGAGMCGYAAAAFSVVAPGATVIAVQPQATLDPLVTEWDHRFARMRRTSFTDRYGFAPDMIEAAGQAFILYDPKIRLDAMHAALFTRPNVTMLRCRNLGTQIDASLNAMGILPAMIEAAGNGAMAAETFWRAYRARRQHLPYLSRLLARLEREHHPARVRKLCNSVLARMEAPRFAQARARADQALSQHVAAKNSLH